MKTVVSNDEPGGREPAPGALGVVQSFLNTNDVEGGTDVFGSVEGLRAWLASARLVGGRTRVSERDRRRAIDVREALRRLIVAREEGRDASAATRLLETAARDTGIGVRVDPGAWHLVSGRRGVDGALSRILVTVAEAMGEGTWPRLKACRRDACRWVFWDASRNRSGAWCTMAICGNRAKGAAYRDRRRAR